MQTVNAKVGTVPMRIVIWGNEPPQIGQRVRWKTTDHRARWEYAIVDRLEPVLFISKM